MKMAALPTKFTCLLLLLLFISAWLDNAHTLSAVEVDTFSSEKGLVDGDGIATTSIKKMGGRKMVLAHNDIKRPDIKGKGALGGTSKISSANDQVVGKYGYEGKEEMSIGGNKRNRGRFSEGVNYEPGSVAFNADYHEPRHHPPKNN